MQRHRVSRWLFACVAVASAVALAGCYSEGAVHVSERHMQPLSERIIADLASRNMAKGSPILVRIFKEEIGARSLEN
jgi:murein L,D-transpeptidase YafK